MPLDPFRFTRPMARGDVLALVIWGAVIALLAIAKLLHG